MLTPSGLGPVRIGMTVEEAARALRRDHIEPPPEGFDEACWEVPIGGDRPGVYIMIQNGRVTSISISKDGQVATEAGIRIGDPEAAVKRAYRGKLKIEGHAYNTPPAHYLTAFTADHRRGIKYSTDEMGRVEQIDAGLSRSIAYIEGCL
jgi:hypothetical protein